MDFGAGAFTGPFIASIAMSTLGAEGYVWTTVVVHAAIGIFLAVRIVQFRAPIRAKPWNDVSIAGRVFYLPATAVGTGRRIIQSRNRRVPFIGEK